MGDRRAPPLAVAAAAACVLLLGAFVVDVRRAGEGGGVAVLGEQRAYTWGIPTSIGGEEPKRRVPVRSTDSMGEILPAMADETMPPGPFKVSGNGRLVVDAQGMSASPIQLSGKATEANPRWRGSQLAAVRTSGLRAATPRDASNPVGVHVVDTADGKVVYYPYMAQPSTGGGQSLHSYAGQQLSAAEGPSGTANPMGGVPRRPAVVQQADGTWTAPYGDYKDLSQGLQSERNALEVERMQKKLSQQKEVFERRINRVKGKVWRDHQKMGDLTRETDRMKVELRQLRFQWRNGPWPMLRGKPGPPGNQGVAGPAGTNGGMGAPGARGRRGKLAHNVILKEDTVEKLHENPTVIAAEVSTDVKQALEEGVTERLHHQSLRMKAMEKANGALMEKMREALHKPTEVDKLLAHPGREEERLIAQYMQKAPAVHHAPLPKGWKKMYDGKGTEYWDNLLTHRTSWTRPAAPAPPLAALSQAAPAPPLAAPKPLVVSKAAQKAADKTADKTPPAGPTAAAKGAAAGRLQAAHARGRGAARR